MEPDIDARRLLALLTLLVAGAVGTGCANHLPDYADKMDEVAVQPTNDAYNGATVDFEESSHEGMAATASNIAKSTSYGDIKGKFDDNVSEKDVVELTRKSISKALENKDGAPFKAAGKGKGQGSIEVVIRSYGIEQDGSQPLFFVNYATTVYYTGNGGKKKLWKTRRKCAPGGDFWDSNSTLVADAGFLDAMQDMSDKEIQSLVQSGFEECSERLVDRMTRAASK